MNTEIKINRKTIDDIVEHYFDSVTFRETYTTDEQKLLKDGFREGIEYLYPLYENVERLNRCYERLEKVGENEDNSDDYERGITDTINWIYQNLALDEPIPEKMIKDELLKRK